METDILTQLGLNPDMFGSKKAQSVLNPQEQQQSQQLTNEQYNMFMNKQREMNDRNEELKKQQADYEILMKSVQQPAEQPAEQPAQTQEYEYVDEDVDLDKLVNDMVDEKTKVVFEKYEKMFQEMGFNKKDAVDMAKEEATGTPAPRPAQGQGQETNLSLQPTPLQPPAVDQYSSYEAYQLANPERPEKRVFIDDNRQKQFEDLIKEMEAPYEEVEEIPVPQIPVQQYQPRQEYDFNTVQTTIRRGVEIRERYDPMFGRDLGF